MGVGRSRLVHPLDVLFDGFRRGFKTDHRRKTPHRGNVVLDGNLAQAAPRVEMPREPRKSGFDRMADSHEASLSGCLVRGVAGVPPPAALRFVLSETEQGEPCPIQ